MQPSKERIEFAARVVGLRVQEVVDGWAWVANIGSGDRLDGDWNGLRIWQPWANNEAGRSDWAVLDTAVCHWLWEFHLLGKDPHPELADACDQLADAQKSGDLKQRQLATFAAAVAIGEQMGGRAT